MEKLLLSVVIPNPPRRVLVSNKRNPKYYTTSKKLPKKYQTKKYGFQRWVGRGAGRKLVPASQLYNLETNEKVVANPKTVGTQRFAVISGQKIWKAQIKEWDRKRMIDAIKEHLSVYLSELDPITDFPLIIKAVMYELPQDEHTKGQPWDVDNRFIIWQKAFQDVLTGNRDDAGNPRSKILIPDDNILYITGPPSVQFIPVSKEEDRKIVFTIYQDMNPAVINHPYFKNNELL